MGKPSLLAESYSERELARQLRKSPRALQRMRALRIGPPFFFVGKTPYYRIEAARAWLRANEVQPVRRRG
jgi:hypothetical protein